MSTQATLQHPARRYASMDEAFVRSATRLIGSPFSRSAPPNSTADICL